MSSFPLKRLKPTICHLPVTLIFTPLLRRVCCALILGVRMNVSLNKMSFRCCQFKKMSTINNNLVILNSSSCLFLDTFYSCCHYFIFSSDMSCANLLCNFTKVSLILIRNYVFCFKDHFLVCFCIGLCAY